MSRDLRTPAIAVALLAAAALPVLAPAPAAAFYGNGALVVSADLARLEQGDDASSLPAISRDGRYVVFQARARNFFADDDPDPVDEYRQGGVFRRDLITGQLLLVADGDVQRESDNALVLRGARNPSVSSHGRYVAFSTAQRLVPEDTNDNVDVYVRDMARPLRSPGAFELVSAQDGGATPARYEPRVPPLPGRNPGSEVSPRAAISADGRKVVFRTVELRSSLPDHAAPDVPGGQLYLRDLGARTTTLLTTDRATGAPAGGAFGPAGISGDGSTVAWTGQNAPAQTRFLDGEIPDPQVNYYLWRRVADGPAAPTRRITGAVDLDDPSCPAGGVVGPDPTALGPCYGPLTGSEQGTFDISQRLPSLSDDGWTVAFVTAAGPRPNTQTGPPLDAWVTSMRPGVSRKAGSRELTRDNPSDSSAVGPVDSATLSGAGGAVALTSTRSRFTLPSIAPVEGFRAVPDTREVYLVDLSAGTIERVTRSTTGGDTNGEASSGADLTPDASRIAFTSAASDLFFGDANERPDVFVASATTPPAEQPPPPEAPAQTPEVQDPDPPAPPRLRVAVRTAQAGSVVLTVRVPSAGTLTAVAQARLPAKKGKTSRKAAKKRRSKPPLTTVARARTTTRVAGTVLVTLRMSRAQQRALRKQRRLAATARIDFAPRPAGRRLKRTVRVTFALPSVKK